MPLFKKIEINDRNVRKSENPMNIWDFINEVSKNGYLSKRIRQYHQMFNSPIKGTLGEELWAKILNDDMGLGEYCNGQLFGWVPESHGIGWDLCVPSLECPRISIKAGKMSKIGHKKRHENIREDHRIAISMHRLTKHADFSEILNFLSLSHYDITFSLSPNKNYDRYFWFVIRNLNFSEMNWEESYSKRTGKHTGWAASSPEQGVIGAKITKNLSSQLWVEFKLSSDRIIHVEEICD